MEHVLSLIFNIETAQCKHCDKHVKLLQEKEIEIRDLKVLLNRHKQELRQQRKGQGNEVQLYSSTLERNNALLLQDQLLKSSEMQADITELNRKNEQLQTVIEALQSVNGQFSTNNPDIDVQMHEFKTKNANLKKRNAKIQSTVTDLIKKSYKMWSHVADVQESITDLKIAVHEVKEDNSKLQSMIFELHLKSEQLQSVVMELHSSIRPMETSIREKLSKLMFAGTEDQQLHLQILHLQEQNDQLKTMITELDKKQGCQEALNLQIQDNVTQVKDIMEKLHEESKQMQTIITELEDKKCQLEVFISALQQTNFKLNAAIPHNDQFFAFSEQQKNLAEENLKLQHENWELQFTISEVCKSKQQLEASLLAVKEKISKLEAIEFDNKKLQLMILEFQNKSNECQTNIIKLEDKNINLQKRYNDLQDYKNELLTAISELQSKLLKVGGVELQNRQFQFLLKDLQDKNAQLNIKIYELSEENNYLKEYISQVQCYGNHHWTANVDLQEDVRPQVVTAENKRRKYHFGSSPSELQSVLYLLKIADTMKERLRTTVSRVQESIFVTQASIFKLHGRIKHLLKIAMELQENSHQFISIVPELQDKIYISDIFLKSQNQHLGICHEKISYNEETIFNPELKTIVASSTARFLPSGEGSLIQVILRVIMVSKEIKIAIENIEVETKELQTSFVDLESRFSEIQLHKSGLLNAEECIIQEIIQQMKQYKITLEKQEEENILLKQKVSELDKRLAEEMSFSNKAEVKIQKQQQAASSEISKLHKSIKGLQSSNMKLEETINWSLERNVVLDVKLAALRNILAVEEFHFSEKEAKTSHQWKIYINQVNSLQALLSEMFTENIALKETIKILDQENVQLQIAISELQSKLKSEKLNVGVQQGDQLATNCCGNSPQETCPKMQKKCNKFTKRLENIEEGKDILQDTMNKLETNVTKKNDEKDTQMNSQQKILDCDENNYPEEIIKELPDNNNTVCEPQITIAEAKKMFGQIDSEMKVVFTGEMPCCTGSDIPDVINQSTLTIFQNNLLLEIPNEKIERNKHLQAYIENLMEEQCLLTGMVSELENKVREVQQHINESEIQKQIPFCECIPAINGPQERECKQPLDQKNTLEDKLSTDAIVVELKERIAREKVHSKILAIQLESQRRQYNAEIDNLQTNVQHVQEKNEVLKETVIKHEEEKKLLEIWLAEKENILSMDQMHNREIQAQMNYQIQLLENQKCQLEDLFDDLLDENRTQDVDVNESLSQVIDDEICSELKQQHCSSEFKLKNNIEPAGRVCEGTKLQEETKTLEEKNRMYELVVEGCRLEKESLTESLSKFKNLFKKQQMYWRENVADLADQLKEANTKVQQLKEKLTALTHTNAKSEEVIYKSEEQIFSPQVNKACNSEGQYCKSEQMECEHHSDDITHPGNSREQSKNCSENKRCSNSYLQIAEETNDSKLLDLKNIQQHETTEELQKGSETKHNITENFEREKIMFEQDVIYLKKMLDFEQCTSNKVKAYLKSKCKTLADQNNGLQEMNTELLDENATLQVSVDNLEKEKELLVFKISELKDEMRLNQGHCTNKTVQKVLSKTIDLQDNLKGCENSNMNLQNAIQKLDSEVVLPKCIVSNFEKQNECQNYQLKDGDIVNNHLHEADQELQDSNTKLQETIFNSENDKTLLDETARGLQDKVIDEHNFSTGLQKNSQTEAHYSANICQQELKENLSKNPHFIIEKLAEGKLEFTDSQINDEPAEGKLYISTNIVQPGSQKDITWITQERKELHESISGERSVPEMAMLKIERLNSNEQLHSQKPERLAVDSTPQDETTNRAMNNRQDTVNEMYHQATKQNDCLASALTSTVDEKDLNTIYTTSQYDIDWNSADVELKNNWLPKIADSFGNMEHLELIRNVKMKKESQLAVEPKLQTKVEEASDGEKAASVCVFRAPIGHTEDMHCQEKTQSKSKRMQEVNEVSNNHQEEERLQKITPSVQEIENSEEEVKNTWYINQSLSIEAAATEFNGSKPSGSKQRTANSELQKGYNNVKVKLESLYQSMSLRSPYFQPFTIV
ncbi:hypothetical protein chiPu_0007855 [Chiloscyllium punctatum]|uniref:Uncharacterized protein n=1 Tax=Chiloscyllium punctatum TaxID=137246 RepID=A0A401SGD5_CHIPU|nr:hypothetical protein [Chiloscyllium punctatum]